ncbi:MAG: alkaline phosphatase family protein [Pedosphaera sp.]|nr:alkaline phosphatase family protein [Pedosphaera sp.]
MQRTAVLNVVGLSSSLIGPGTPRILKFLERGSRATILPAFPAVTCTAQSNYVTGQLPTNHGIVANGWYHRELAEVQFWKQSNHIVHGRKIWDDLGAIDSSFTCAKLFWWYNMYSTADYSITPRPMYPADGRKLFDIYTAPSGIRGEIQKDLGPFPFPGFWGPAAGVNTPQGSADSVTKWIAASARWIEEKHQPTLSLVYLPHLDYNLQRFGPSDPSIARDLARIDSIVGDLIDFFERRAVRLIILSEYGITEVSNPIHLNRVFRERGWLTIREELGLELLDAGASRAFAVADHQVAHIYVNDPSIAAQVREVTETQEGVELVLGPADKARWGINHARSGDLVAVSASDAWFTYYYWLDDARAPDFARCVDIHRKPGYDPVELFLDPHIPLVKLKILRRLLQKKLGFRMLMDVIPLDATLVKGSHGRRTFDSRDQPVLLTNQPGLLTKPNYESTEIHDLISRTVLENG